jgi:uncharacterized protein YlxP (DUF503 family)
MMVVGTMRITLTLFESASLKDKRSVVRRVRDRVGNRFNASIAEIELLNDTEHAVLGIACVSNESAHAHAQLMKILAFVEKLRLDAEVSDIETEIVAL